MNVEEYVLDVCQSARAASAKIGAADTAQKNAALLAIADRIDEQSAELITENARDLEAGKLNGLDDALLDRLTINEERVAGMSESIRQIAALRDPVGEIKDLQYMPSGIQVGKMRVPLGVLGIIYESRPNVTADAAALGIKSGNAVVLRGGSEAIFSNTGIAACINYGLEQAGLDQHTVQVLETTDRAAVGVLLQQEKYVDVIIPRGGKGLIQRVAEESKIPVIKHLDGICHVFVDAEADMEKAVAIADNAKTHRYGVCNAMETLLVDETVAAEFLPQIGRIYSDKGVEIRACEKSINHLDNATVATDEDWDTEYLSPVISIKTVNGVDEAVDHINSHGSHHTDSIVTENYGKSRDFTRRVDSSSVMVNASTRFADGFEYGLGAEIGISTDRLHVRGPVGIEGLTTMKNIVLGNGHIRK